MAGDIGDKQSRHLLHVFATFAPAGPQVRVATLIREFGPTWRHTIVAMDGRVDARDLLPREVETTVLDAPPSGTWPRMRHLKRVLAEQDPDLLLTYNWGSFDAVMLARALGVRHHVHHEDGFNQDEASSQKQRRVLTRRLALTRAAAVVVCSHRLRDIALREWRLPDAQVRLIPNGIVGSAMRDGDADRVRAELDIPADALVVGAVGHLRPVKNFARLIDAAARVSRESVGSHPLHLLILGDGELRASLEDQGVRNAPPGGRVHFAGHQTDLRDHYAAMDLFALSSDSEQHPIALLEAMSAGLPVVATDVGDVRAVLPPVQQRFVVPLDGAVDGLSRVMGDLLSSVDDRTMIGDANRRHVGEHYSLTSMVDAYRKVYGGALRG